MSILILIVFVSIVIYLLGTIYFRRNEMSVIFSIFWPILLSLLFIVGLLTNGFKALPGEDFFNVRENNRKKT